MIALSLARTISRCQLRPASRGLAQPSELEASWLAFDRAVTPLQASSVPPGAASRTRRALRSRPAGYRDWSPGGGWGLIGWSSGWGRGGRARSGRPGEPGPMASWLPSRS